MHAGYWKTFKNQITAGEFGKETIIQSKTE